MLHGPQNRRERRKGFSSLWSAFPRNAVERERVSSSIPARWRGLPKGNCGAGRLPIWQWLGLRLEHSFRRRRRGRRRPSLGRQRPQGLRSPSPELSPARPGPPLGAPCSLPGCRGQAHRCTSSLHSGPTHSPSPATPQHLPWPWPSVQLTSRGQAWPPGEHGRPRARPRTRLRPCRSAGQAVLLCWAVLPAWHAQRI